MKSEFEYSLMHDNVTDNDIDVLVEFLQQKPIPRLTCGPKVFEFEDMWSEWLGVKYSVMVNSGASANELTMLALSELYGEGEVIVPPLTWISDISSVIFAGHTPVFCDINFNNLSFDLEKLKLLINEKTRAIFLTHVLGLSGLTDELMELINENNILLIEDVCESHGATYNNKKLGSIGFASNFSFYFAHHMTTIEGGMICTNDSEFYQIVRALRGHGMVRDMTDEETKNKIYETVSDLNKEFVFIRPSHNMRPTEINAVLGINQLKRLDDNNLIRSKNFEYFIEHLDKEKYFTDFNMSGQCNYAFILVLKESSFETRDLIEKRLKEHGVEFRRGLSGGGNQLRQPYMKKNFIIDFDDFPNIEHIHNFSWYIGNYPSLEREKIDNLLKILNSI